MLVIHRSHGSIVKGDHCVYTVEEADQAGIKYVHWRHGRENMWVVSDDGYVLELLQRKEYYDSRRSKISRVDLFTVFYWFGCARATSWAKKLFIHRHLKGMGHITGKTWQEGFVSSGKGRAWIKMAAVMMLNNELDHMVLGEFMGFDRKYPDSTRIMVRRYLRDRLIENAIIIQMSEFLSDKGITYESVLDEYRDVLKKAKRDGKYSDALKILEKFERWTGLNQKISGDKVELDRSQDVVGQHIERMLAERAQPKELPGGMMGLKVPASVDRQVFDENGNRVEYIEVPVNTKNQDNGKENQIEVHKDEEASSQ